MEFNEKNKSAKKPNSEKNETILLEFREPEDVIDVIKINEKILEATEEYLKKAKGDKQD